MNTKVECLYFIFFEPPTVAGKDGWWVVSRSASKRREISRASTLGGALSWVRDRQEKAR